MSTHFQETLVIGGGPQDFPTVRHLILRGSNYEIGKQLAEVVTERYNVRTRLAFDPRIIHARCLYFQQHYPILLERARGVADAFGLNLDDNTIDMASLMYPNLLSPQTVGCSVVFYPPQTTTNAHGSLSRNCDAQRGSILEMLGVPIPPGIQLKPAYSEPYVMEVYPDIGYPSLYLACTDLLGACFDGINSEGLTVSLMADGDPSNTSSHNEEDEMTSETYRITIKGHLDGDWSDWFDGLTITLVDNGETTLTGPIVDQTALHGVLIKIRDLGLPLLGVSRIEPEKGVNGRPVAEKEGWRR